MNSTILNYPGFQTLPKGVKQMLLVSEAHFFDQPASHPQEHTRTAQPTANKPRFRGLFAKPMVHGGRRFGLYQPDATGQPGACRPWWPGNLQRASHVG
jgi:hypothetical protein